MIKYVCPNLPACKQSRLPGPQMDKCKDYRHVHHGCRPKSTATPGPTTPWKQEPKR